MVFVRRNATVLEEHIVADERIAIDEVVLEAAAWKLKAGLRLEIATRRVSVIRTIRSRNRLRWDFGVVVMAGRGTWGRRWEGYRKGWQRK